MASSPEGPGFDFRENSSNSECAPNLRQLKTRFCGAVSRKRPVGHPGPKPRNCIGCSPDKRSDTRTMATGFDGGSRHSAHDRRLCIAVQRSERPRRCGTHHRRRAQGAFQRSTAEAPRTGMRRRQTTACCMFYCCMFYCCMFACCMFACCMFACLLHLLPACLLAACLVAACHGLAPFRLGV
jgi:hypothetical protein